jgi:hypothetical protein
MSGDGLLVAMVNYTWQVDLAGNQPGGAVLLRWSEYPVSSPDCRYLHEWDRDVPRHGIMVFIFVHQRGSDPRGKD